MTKEQIKGFREALKGLSPAELYELKAKVDEEIEDQYWSDENFFHREQSDSYIYIVVYADLSYHYTYLGKKAYDEYMKNDNAIRIECKDKHLFPQYKVLMQKGEFYGQKRV